MTDEVSIEHDSSMNMEVVGIKEEDSYMGNEADESANVSVSIHQTTSSNEIEPIEDEDPDLSAHANFEIKPEGKSYKYPVLKRYYEFGPWVGRNRKAICIRCKHQSASSQPERLIKHMKRCPKLSANDKTIADGLLVESNANKKGRPKTRARSSSETELADEDTPKRPTRRTDNTMTSERRAEIDQALTKFIMCCRIPLKSIQSKEFIAFVRAMNPDYTLPSTETITNTLIPGLLNIL